MDTFKILVLIILHFVAADISTVNLLVDFLKHQ